MVGPPLSEPTSSVESEDCAVLVVVVVVVLVVKYAPCQSPFELYRYYYNYIHSHCP